MTNWDKAQNKFCGVCGEENEIFHEDFKDGDEVTWREYFSGRNVTVLSGKLKKYGVEHDKETKAYLEKHKPITSNAHRYYNDQTPLSEIPFHGLNHHLDGMALTAKEWYKNI